MDFILLEYIENEKFGKLAHFIDNDNKDTYAKVFEDGEEVYYQELSEKELKELKSMIEDD